MCGVVIACTVAQVVEASSASSEGTFAGSFACAAITIRGFIC